MLWVNGDLPSYATASIQSFLKQGHSVHLWTYNLEIKAPPNCVIRNAEDVLSADKIFGYAHGEYKGHLSGFSDWFRYQLLFDQGGWWSDIDVICVQPFVSTQRFCFASNWEPKIFKCVNNNVIFSASAGEDIFRDAIAICEQRGSAVEHAETGPTLLFKLVQAHSLLDCVAEPYVFNPISYYDIAKVVMPKYRLIAYSWYRRIRSRAPIYVNHSETMGVHLFSALLNRQTNLTALLGDDQYRSSYLRSLVV
ncbi:MAG: glycosyltransferase [Pseudomonadota bacterium]